MKNLELWALLGLFALAPACGGGSDDDTETGDDDDDDDDTGDDDDDTAGDDDDDDDTTEVDCSERPTDIPTARGEIEGTFSPLSRRFVFFGGDEGIPIDCRSQTDFVADTWLWEEDCGNWREVEGDQPEPTARYAHGYDPVRDRFLIHGGRYRNGLSGDYTLRSDLWAFSFDTEEWELLSDGGPSARAIHAGAVAGDQFVIFGGTGSTDGLSYTPLYDDVWVFDLTSETWTELDTTGGGPGGRVFHAMASDGGETVYVYAGGDENAFFGPFFTDLWALDLASGEWTQADDGSQFNTPDGRIWPDLLFDEATGGLVMWAGHDDQALGNTNQLYTWSEADRWTKVEGGDEVDAGSNGFCDFPADFTTFEEGTPERRYGAAAALTDDGQLLTFGGKTDCGIINDFWAYDLDTNEWTMHLRATDGESCVRAFDPDSCSSLCF